MGLNTFSSGIRLKHQNSNCHPARLLSPPEHLSRNTGIYVIVIENTNNRGNTKTSNSRNTSGENNSRNNWAFALSNSSLSVSGFDGTLRVSFGYPNVIMWIPPKKQKVEPHTALWKTRTTELLFRVLFGLPCLLCSGYFSNAALGRGISRNTIPAQPFK